MIADDLQNVGPLEEVETRQRLRVTYAKQEAIKFISHQDEFRLWERTLRRADLPLLYKQGFNPQPHMHFAAPLAVGMTGACETMDFTLASEVPVEEIEARLHAKLPPGASLLAIEEIALNADSLANTLIGADYTAIFYVNDAELPRYEVASRIDHFLSEAEIWRERERKGERYTYNLRPLVFELRLLPQEVVEEQQLFMRVQQRAGATGRPDEVVTALGLDDFARTLRRDRLYFAANAADAAVFAHYPVIEQRAIAGPRPAQRPRAGKPEVRERGRSLGERAADEFV